ncbi:E3 ubiquitin-protein ligase tom1 [Tilletia horrida]|uniref:E3 ubiquitin-protein ligase tom1 n=1 Tax=Tilletia horrida TaxID=155126 RepID=A0AAN6GTE5_9BASI|nr:E3 ubiquitin-protein ligase tom1 [Tilletia horrida]KAK0556383.1 E3 ubiquitin-protein ligase tom1 [Tilletia horrida]KAK0569283.1 E3 ubiquitin-protein ligase tom1 [Tilletia horrida]
MKITKSKKLAPATPELSALLAQVSAVSDDDLPAILDSISEWCWPRGDLHYWIPTLNRFDTILEKIVKDYEIKKVQTNEFTPLCKKLLLSTLRFSRLLIENCTNRKLYSSFEHLNELLLTRDIDVLETTLRLTLRLAQQRSSSGHSSRHEAHLSHARLCSLAITWPSSRGASDMAALCKPETIIPSEASNVHFSFYRPSSSVQAEDGAASSTTVSSSSAAQGEASTSSNANAHAQTPARPARSRPAVPTNTPITPANQPAAGPSSVSRAGNTPANTNAVNAGLPDSSAEGLVTIDLTAAQLNAVNATDVFADTVERFAIPDSEHFELFQRIRVAKGLGDAHIRKQLVSCRLFAIACYTLLASENTANSQLFIYERELVAKTANLLEPDNHIPQEVKAAATYALDGMARYRGKLASVLNSVQASVSHGLLVRVLRELVEELNQPNPSTVDIYVDSVFGFTALLSSIPNATGNGMAMSTAVLPLLIKVVSIPEPDEYMVQRTIVRAAGLIDSIISTQSNTYAVYYAAHGVETLVNRVQAEVDRDIKDYQSFAAVQKVGEETSYGNMPFGRATLLRHLLKSIYHDLQGAGTPESLRALLDSSLLASVKKIMQNRKVFGPQIFALAINIMASFVHNEPTTLSTIQEHKLPELFLDCVEAEIEAHFEVIIAIPNAIGALSLNEAGVAMFAARPVIGRLLSLFTSDRHIKVLQDEESAANFGQAIDELVRHQPSMKDSVFSGINAIFDRIIEVGKAYTPPESQRPYYQLYSSVTASSSAAPSAPEVEMAVEEESSGTGSGTTSSGQESPTPGAQPSEDESNPLSNAPKTSEEHAVLSYIKAMARFLEMLFQTPHHCKDFLKSDGFAKLLSLYDLPCLPADFYNHMAGDALVQLVRFLADTSPNSVFQALFKDIKGAIDAVPLDFRASAPGPSQLVPTVSAGDEEAAAKSQDLYRKSIALSIRIHLLADCLSTYNVPGHKLPSGFLSSLFPSEAKSLELIDLGYQFRFWIWENLQITSNINERKASKDSSTSSAVTAASAALEEQTNATEAQAAGASNDQASSSEAVNGNGSAAKPTSGEEDDVPEEAIENPSTSKKALTAGSKAEPELANLDVWQEMSSAISSTIRDFFQELTRLLSPRRSSEASSLRRHAPNALEQVAQAIICYYQWADQMNGQFADFSETGYATIVLRHTMALMYDERSSSSSRTQTQLIWKFAQLDGFQALFRLYGRFNDELTKHFEGQSGVVTHALKFHHICGALRILLSLFQNLTTAKLLQESSHTAQLVGKDEPKSSPNYFEPADFLVKVRAQVLTLINATTTSNWIQHLPISVNRVVIQILLEILRGEGETPAMVKKDEAQAGADRFASSILSSLAGASANLRRATASANVNEAHIRQLADMGFPRNAARHALIRTNNDVTAATEYLILHPELVQTMADEPSGTGTPSNAGEGASSSATAEASSSGTAADGSSATAAATGDGDTAMTEATSSTSTGGAWGATGTAKEPERKTPEKDQPFTDAGMAAKEQLDKEREELRGTIFQRTLELANHHEDLVFEVRDAFSLVSADHDRATDSIQALLGIVMSAGSASYGDQEKQVAVRMHALAVILNDDKLFKILDDDTTDTVMNVSMMLLSEYESRPQQEAHTAWFASALLSISPLLSLESKVVAPSRITPEQDRGPVPIEKILPNLNKFASERETLLSFTLAMLSNPTTLKKEGFLALFRILVHLTRRRSAAAEFLKRGGLQLLFQPFRLVSSSEVSTCQAQALIILRNVVEDTETLRATMEQELQSWLSLIRSKSADVASMTRQLSHVVMRDPEAFLSVAKDRLQMTDWSVAKDNGNVRLVLSDTQAPAQSKTTLPAELHEADSSFAGPASPTKGAHDFEMDASMHELGHDRTDIKMQATSESAESVIHFLLSELHKSTKDASICRKSSAQPSKPSAATAPTVSKSGTTSAVSNGEDQNHTTGEAKSSSPDGAESEEVSPEKKDQDAAYVFACFLMQTLMELLSSYMSCKLAFVNLCKRRSATIMEGTSQPRLKISMLQYFLNELIPSGYIHSKEHEELRKRMAWANWAMSVIVALTADVALNTSIKDTPAELVNVRRYVLDGITRALREAVSSTEPTEARYGRIFAQADLCFRLLTARPNVTAGKPSYDASLHMAKTMLEKHFVTVLTTTLGEIDLKTPSVKPLLETILRPLEHLTKAAIKMGKAERKARQEGDEQGDIFMSDEEEDDESESLSTLEEEALLERDQRQETPDFYRNSSLGMHTGEMEQQPIYDDEDMEDEDEMDEDDVDMGEYDSEEDGSDLSSDDDEEIDADALDEDDMSDDESDDDSEDSDEDEDMDESEEDDEDGDDDDSWSTEDEDEEGAEDEAEAALDFVVGEGEDGEEVLEGALVGEYIGEPPLHHAGLIDPAVLEGDDGEDGETEEDAMSAEEPYDIDELAHLEFADEVAAAVGRGQADDRFGANWGWTAIPPQQLLRDPAAGPSHMHNRSSRSRRQLSMMDPHMHSAVRPPAAGENAAYHPLLEQRSQADSQQRQSHSHRSARRMLGGWDGRHDSAGLANTFEQMMGTGTLQLLENLVGLGPTDAAIRIDVSTGPGGMGHFRVDGDAAFLQTLFSGGPALANAQAQLQAQRDLRAHRRREDPVAQTRQFNPLPTGQRWSEAARIVHGAETLERSQQLKGHIIDFLMPAYLRLKEEEERKRDVELEQRRQRLEAKAKSKAIEEKMSKSLTLVGTDSSDDGADQSENAEMTGDAQHEEPSNASDSFATAQDTTTELSSGSAAEATVSATAELSSATGGADVEMADADPGQGAATPRASTPRPSEPAASSAAAPAASADGQPSNSAQSGADASTSASATQERQYTYVNGQRIDITDTGIDPTFLEALPDEMREEVLNQHFRERRAAATTAAAANSNIAPEFLEALPPEIRAEVIQQEQLENARRRAAEAGQNNAANADREDEEDEGGDQDDFMPDRLDPEELLASLNPSMRGNMLLDNPDNLLAGLQSSLLGGAVAARRRHHAHHHRHAAAGADAAAAAKKAPPRDAIQLLDKGGVATLIRLLFFPDMNGRKNGLYNILNNLSENSKSRADVLNLLLSILSDGTTDAAAVDRSFASMSIRASRTASATAALTPHRPTPKRSASSMLGSGPGVTASSSILAGSTTAPISMIGDEAPFLIATRVLESLLHLTTVNEQATTFFLKDDVRLIKKTGKGKDREKADNNAGKAAGTAPINTLLMLLKRPDILANAQLVDALLAVLNTVTKPLVTLQAKRAADANGTKSGAAAPAPNAGDSPPQASASTTDTTSAASVAAPLSGEGAATTNAAAGPDANAPAPADTTLEVPPQIAADRLSAVVRPLATPISSKGFQHTLSVASHLASLDGARDTIGSALKSEAEMASKSLIVELDRLLESLPVRPPTAAPLSSNDMDTSGDQPSSQSAVGAPGSTLANGAMVAGDSEAKLDSPALTAMSSPASAQAVFLRSLRALDYLMTGR